MINNSEQNISTQKALMYALLAYGSWGLFPLYWALLKGVPAMHLLAHRIVWSFFLLVIMISISGRWGEIVNGIKSKKVLMLLLVSTMLISVNWLTFIWAATNERVLETSLGYYINPLVSVFLGWLFLKEKLRRLPLIALCFAAVGVSILTVSYGKLPVVSLILAFSFGFYTLVRKVVKINSQPALLIETALAFLPSLIYLLLFSEQPVFYDSLSLNLLLIGMGVLTVLPLVWLAMALKILPLSTIGFCQYLAPTMQFLLAVLIFKEEFTWVQALTFILIWLGLIIFSYDGLKRHRSRRRHAIALNLHHSL